MQTLRIYTIVPEMSIRRNAALESTYAYARIYIGGYVIFRVSALTKVYIY